MEVRVSVRSDEDTYQNAPLVHSIDRACEKFFADRNYGGGIDNLDVAVVWTPHEEALCSLLPFKFAKRVVINVPPFPRKELFNSVTYEIAQDYDYIRNHDAEAVLSFISMSLYESTEVLGSHTHQYPRFDVAAFRADLRTLLNLPT